MRDIIAGMDERDSQPVHLCRGAEADFHGLLCSEGHRIPLLLLNKPLVSGSHLYVFGVRLWSTGLVYEAFRKDFTCGASYFSAMLNSTADTSSCVSLRYEVFVVPVVVHDMCRMVQTMQNCLEVPQVQFLRGCGRRFVLAATSSRQSRDGVQIRSSTSSRRTDLGFLPYF